MEELIDFIQGNPDPRELKRALAVQMVMQNYIYSDIGKILGVSVGFVNKWKYIFVEQGITGLLLKHKGSKGYLNCVQRSCVIEWLKHKNYWHLAELKEYIEDTFGVVFESNQSYYELFKQASISWKKTQKKNPNKDPELVGGKKTEIIAWLDAHQRKIVSGEMVVLFEDECHLLWGDICGYVWGNTSERIEVPVRNEKQRQTYFGALYYYTQEFLIKPYEKGNSQCARAFLEYLLTQYPKSRITLIWDGASYHRSAEIREYLNLVNKGLAQDEWKITCIRFAPNAPEQNPVEDIWLQAKKFVREFYHLCNSFTSVKRLFKLVTHHQIFNFQKIFMYDSFSRMI
ncbi:IS630 family transposase [Tolypothrix sp. VBCCA 56010]|uniref:IS630 family transposase n=1 Tax=Tolypothrix sp. VBCCA 56010 TaxID=3137731 RepID=UPI003D7E9E94